MKRTHRIKNGLGLAASILTPVPWIVAQASDAWTPSDLGVVLMAGFAILASAFLLSWATELGEQDLPQSFALLVLALVSVLPEYAVDLHFAWQAGKDPASSSLAVANMTGANRLLIGIGWAAVAFVACHKESKDAVMIRGGESLELRFLLLATMYGFFIPLGGDISLFDGFVLIALFLGYAHKAMKSSCCSFELVGPPCLIDEFCSNFGRRAWGVILFVFAAYAIWISAAPFADGLVHIGEKHGVDKFLLVQWVAPLASESPEFIVAILFALRLRGDVGLGALISSKVNQWTLLVGAIPIAYCISAGTLQGLPLDMRQSEEILLTAAQSLLAVVLAANLRFGRKEASILMGLFLVQLVFEELRQVFIPLYIVLSLLILAFGPPDQRRGFMTLLVPSWPTRMPLSGSEEDPPG